MDQREWLAHFAAREARAQQWLAERAAYHARVGAKIVAEVHPVAVAPLRPVVLVRGHDVGPGEDGVPAAAGRLSDLAHSLGWAARVVASLAADPGKGLIAAVTVRFSRHDERGYAAWWNGSYSGGWYVSPAGLEALAGTRMRSRKPPKDGGAMIRGYQDVVEGIRSS